MKRTAVISDTFKTFKRWCRERRIERDPNGYYIDFEGEVYVPIVHMHNIRGNNFTGYEEIKGVYNKNHYDLIEQIKIRIR